MDCARLIRNKSNDCFLRKERKFLQNKVLRDLRAVELVVDTSTIGFFPAEKRKAVKANLESLMSE